MNTHDGASESAQTENNVKQQTISFHGIAISDVGMELRPAQPQMSWQWSASEYTTMTTFPNHGEEEVML